MLFHLNDRVWIGWYDMNRPIQGWRMFTSHFTSPTSLILSTLHLLERRLWPPAAVPSPSSNLLARPSTPPQSQGFTALILTYNRLESLFQVQALLLTFLYEHLKPGYPNSGRGWVSFKDSCDLESSNCSASSCWRLAKGLNTKDWNHWWLIFQINFIF